MTTSVRQWLDFALLQSAAESYLDKLDLTSDSDIQLRLQTGNNRPEMLNPPKPADADQINGVRDDF